MNQRKLAYVNGLAEMKKVAKNQPGSYIAVDRRKADSGNDGPKL